MITGSYNDGYFSHGFLRAPDGTITTFDPPGSLSTFANGINPNGVITGWCSLPHTFLFGIVPEPHGFLRTPDGTFTTFGPGFSYTNALAINPSGVITGWYAQNEDFHHDFGQARF